MSTATTTRGLPPVATAGPPIGPIGLMHQMWAMRETTDAQFFKETTEDVVVADELGFDSVWIAEHHYVRKGVFYPRLPQPELLLASLIPLTQQIKLATGIKLLVLDGPEQTAEKFKTLAVLSGGRTLFGLGQGSPDELGVLTMTVDEKRALFRSRLESLVGCLDQAADAELALTPRWDGETRSSLYAAVRDDESVEQAARLGVNFIVGEAELGASQAKYVRRYREAGGLGEARGARLVCVGETHEEAVAAASEAAGVLNTAFAGGRYAAEQVEAGLLSSAVATSDDEVFGRLEYAVGTPDEVAVKLLEYIDTTGVNALNIMVHSPGMKQEAAQRSMRLFMSDVAPALSPALAAKSPQLVR
jgi:alkanesulfonate monooxygenase SsuD/methylene tetrahydromethanopterin reductase-like flavin-dependent oxidoreductase (luciferase family)